jgi:NADH-quinone oxidoreductase subunit F
MPTIAFVKKFRKEFEDHLEGKGCPYPRTRQEELVVV